MYVVNLFFEENLDYLATSESIISILLNIILGVTAIKGFSYLLELRDKTLGATFNFWAQLKVRIDIVKKYSSEADVLANICDVELRKELGVATVDQKSADNISQYIKDLYLFLETSSDQMPAYDGWTEDINKLCGFLLDTQYYDITKSAERFKFNKNDSVDDYRLYIKENIDNMENIITKITDKQKELEKKINQSTLFNSKKSRRSIKLKKRNRKQP